MKRQVKTRTRLAASLLISAAAAATLGIGIAVAPPAAADPSPCVMCEDNDLVIQNQMDRRSKLDNTLTDIFKHNSDTSNSISQNMK
jgi:hypothetical protein